jgi:hypothetical protein
MRAALQRDDYYQSLRALIGTLTASKTRLTNAQRQAAAQFGVQGNKAEVIQGLSREKDARLNLLRDTYRRANAPDEEAEPVEGFDQEANREATEDAAERQQKRIDAFAADPKRIQQEFYSQWLTDEDLEAPESHDFIHSYWEWEQNQQTPEQEALIAEVVAALRQNPYDINLSGLSTQSMLSLLKSADWG